MSAPLIGLTAILLLTLILCVLYAFRRTILAPLQRVGASLRHYHHHGERRSVDGQSNDELGAFIADYNAVLRRQEQSELDLIASMAQTELALKELKQAQAGLVQTAKLAATGQLTAGVAHEINNPTNFIAIAAQNLEVELRGFREFLLQLAGEEADREVVGAIDQRIARQTEQLSIILDGTRRIGAIVRDLRTFARLDEAEQKQVSIVASLRATLNLLNTRYRDGLRFVTDFAADPPLECFPAQINQVLMNLLMNACEAVDARHRDAVPGYVGEVRIGTRLYRDGLRVEFTDNGCGMTANVQERALEPFFTTKPIGAGTGLGLSVAYAIVKEHGGELDIESQPNVGTRVSAWLPVNALPVPPDPVTVDG